MDVIALAQHGISNATATLGTATSKTHLERVYRLTSPKWCFASMAMKRAQGGLSGAGGRPALHGRWRQAKFLFLPEGEDPDDRGARWRRRAFQRAADDQRNAAGRRSCLKHSAEGLDMDSLDGRARMSKLALPYIRQLPEGVLSPANVSGLARAHRPGTDQPDATGGISRPAVKTHEPPTRFRRTGIRRSPGLRMSPEEQYSHNPTGDEH